MKFKVEITGTKTVTVDAEFKSEAEEIANQMPLKLGDFDWIVEAEEEE